MWCRGARRSHAARRTSPHRACPASRSSPPMSTSCSSSRRSGQDLDRRLLERLPRARARSGRAPPVVLTKADLERRPGRGRRGDRGDRRRDSVYLLSARTGLGPRCIRDALGQGTTGCSWGRLASEVHPRQRADRRRIAAHDGRGRARRSGAAHDDPARARPPPERRGHRGQPGDARGASVDRRRRSDRCVR
jgi:hypothetical protein